LAINSASRHHAKLAVNAAKTVADFLFETKTYQAKKGGSSARVIPPEINGYQK